MLLMREKATFDEYANKYDKWFDTPEGKIVKKFELELLLKFINPRKGKSMLEIGIGTGLFAMEFRKMGMAVSGIDPSEEMMKIAQSRGFEVKKGVGENIPFEDNSFDVTLAMTSIEFSREPAKFVKEMKRVTKPGGNVVVAALNLLSLYGIERRIRGIFEKNVFTKAHFYTFWELKRLLYMQLKEVKTSSCVFTPPNPSDYILKNAEKIEKLGVKYLKPFGALLVGKGVK
jgi:ubiquinone/menaquinone biosynthesis C-methylase UbiE